MIIECLCLILKDLRCDCAPSNKWKEQSHKFKICFIGEYCLYCIDLWLNKMNIFFEITYDVSYNDLKKNLYHTGS